MDDYKASLLCTLRKVKWSSAERNSRDAAWRYLLGCSSLRKLQVTSELVYSAHHSQRPLRVTNKSLHTWWISVKRSLWFAAYRESAKAFLRFHSSWSFNKPVYSVLRWLTFNFYFNLWDLMRAQQVSELSWITTQQFMPATELLISYEKNTHMLISIG